MTKHLFTRSLAFGALILCIALMTTVPAGAFDNNRKGFVLGGGIGYAPSVKTTVDASGQGGFGNNLFLGSAAGNEEGIGFQFLAGLGISERDLLVVEGNVGWFYYKNVPVSPDLVDDVQVMQGTQTLSWYHYYGSKGSSLFTAVGGGFGYFDTDYSDRNKPGAGFKAAIGYEFTPHLQFGVYYSSFSTSNEDFAPLKLDGTHSNVSILLSAIAF